MSEREVAEVAYSRPDQLNRSHKNISSRSKDKHSRKGRLETPPTFTTPTRHPRHHSGSHGRQRGERRRGRVDEHEKMAALPAQNGGERKKKMSLNHLLSFTLSPREAGQGMGEGGRRRRNKTHSYNKEQFLQANCQFVVADRGEYSVHTSDPDLLVDWDSIELVRLFCHEIPSCPICLYPPTAAKMTRCGHVYCWTCVLHYLSLGDKKWRKCPICYESIYKKDLKSVTALSTRQYSAGDVITMKLMVREKDTTLVVPSDQRSQSPAALPSLTAPGGRFMKLLTCSPGQSLEVIVGREREALTSQLREMGPDEASEQCFVEQALQELEAREECLLQSEAAGSEEDTVSPSPPPPPPPLADSSTPLPPQPQWTALDDVQGNTTPAFSDSEREEEEEEEEGGSASSSMSDENHTTSCQAEGGSLETSMEQLPTSTTPPTPPDSSLVYFYQSDDGQHIYLHTVNARCLVKEYGGLEFAPEVIKARIVEMEHLSMTEDVRGRYKYLGHLPVTCEFALCELDLRPPIVSPETLSYYREDLERRRHRRAKKKREERRREKTAATSERPPPTRDAFPLPTSLAHPPLSPERIHDLLPQLTSTSPPSHLTTAVGHPPETQGSLQEEMTESSTAHPSFAEALRGKPPPVWLIKTPPRQQTAITRGEKEGEGAEEGGEGETVPSFQEAFTQALLTAQVSTQQGQCSKKTAKKGRKKLVLFSTGGARGGQS